MHLIRNSVLLGCAACSSPTPFWALDPVFIAPTVEGTSGTVTWQVYSEAWKKKFSEKHYLCSVIVGLEATPSATDCEACVVAFELTSEVTDSDCSEALLADPLFLSTRRIGVGALNDAGPYTGASSVGWADYGGGWEVHGWAYPEAVANGQQPTSFTWDGIEAFSFTPTAAWQLERSNNSGLTPLSRSAGPGDDGALGEAP